MRGGGVQLSCLFLLYIHFTTAPDVHMCIAASLSIYWISVGYERLHIHTITAMRPLADLN